MSESPEHEVRRPSGAAVLDLRHEHDLILLRRHLRQLGDECNFDPRSIERLSSAAYEGARELFSARSPASAEICVVDEGPRTSVRVVLRAAMGEGAPRDEALERLHHVAARLTPLVSRVVVEDTADGVALCLIAEPAGGPAARADLVDRLVEHDAPAPASRRTEYEPVQEALRDMQIELQETNRGVVALYAELDGQAERLRSAEDRLRMLLDSVEDYAICMLGRDGEIVSWNIGGERLFGYQADDIVGRNYACFFTPADREDAIPEEHLREALRAGRHAVEGLRIRRGGSAFDAHVLLATVRNPDGSHRGFSLVVRDITARKRLEADLRRRAEDLEAANRAKEDFLATLSHELRTPLNAMLGWTRLLRSGRLDEPTQARALETIERNARMQEQLIADILDVSRIVTGKLRVDLRPIDVAPIVQAAVDAVRPTAEAKGVALESAIAFTGTIMGDADRLQQVVWNLLSNAIKFTPGGGRVDVSAGRAGATASIMVSDSGEGIAADLLPYVFDRFRQGDASATRPHGGLGLGLSIVRHIVELHGGQAEAWSEGPGHGATFAVRLPVRAVQHVEDRPDQLPLVGVKILVVDDDPDAREVVSLALAQYGARTAAVASAREAILAIPAFQPDVVVSDIAMPGEDGYSLMRKIRGLSSEAATLPVVALTGAAGLESRTRALGAGFRHFVPKPVEVDELAAVVRTVVERRRE